ncbi:MAG: TylF/MycF/NovP-related O-methyltransferase [Chlamydiota bacterium]
MLTTLKQRLRRRVQHYVHKGVEHAFRDIDLIRQLEATRETAQLVNQSMRMTRNYPDKFALLSASLKEVENSGLYCEFGVYGGATINFIASHTPSPVHGFDSFEGLPEDWRSGYEKGAFALRCLPVIRKNVCLHRGWFEETIPQFQNRYSDPIAFLHLDADLYSSTKTVFDLLGDRIVQGTVIQFDEFFNYPGWREGEYKAFSEFCAFRKVDVSYVGYVSRDQQVALKILTIDSVGSSKP